MKGKQHNPNGETRDAVHLMTSRGATQSMAAAALGIEEKCLRRHYRDELDGGVVQADRPWLAICSASPPAKTQALSLPRSSG
jgi:hypothetical protein